MKATFRILTAIGVAANITFAGYSLAQENSFSLELNSAKDNETGCTLTIVAKNGTGMKLDKTSYEVGFFNKDGGFSQFFLLEFGKLALNKTKIVQFDLEGKKCSDISRLLINDVSDCESDGKTVHVCLDTLKTNSRTNIEFGT